MMSKNRPDIEKMHTLTVWIREDIEVEKKRVKYILEQFIEYPGLRTELEDVFQDLHRVDMGVQYVQKTLKEGDF